MIDSDLDRRLRHWMVDREPASVPPAIYALARVVAEETPTPLAWRVRGVHRWRSAADAPRMAFVLAVLGLLLAAVAANLLVGRSSQPSPLPGVDRWGGFVVGQVAPSVAWTASGPDIADNDDHEVEFEDLVGSVVVVIAPSGGDITTGLTEAEAIRARVGGGTHLIVGARTLASFESIAGTGASGMDLTPAELTDTFPRTESAVVVIDRNGRVAHVFAGDLSGADQVVDIVTSLEGQQ
jgi:hypothetical protein